MKGTKTSLFALTVAATAFLAGRATSTTAPQEGESYAQEAGMGAAMPGKMHRMLDPMEGEFEATCSFWMMPGAEPMQMTGTMSSSWILGGHVLRQDFSGEMMGMPFQGIGFMAYSDAEEAYQTIWMDNQSNHIIFSSEGEMSDDGKKFVSMGMNPDPMAGGMVKVKDVIEIHGKDKHVFTQYKLDDAGKETKSMEIAYMRK